MESIAIIGTGIAGMGCAHFLHRHFDIDVYEQNNYVGGHTNTVRVNENGKHVPVDTGFIVFNNVTYPNLVRLFRSLEVPVKPTNMSFSVQDQETGLEYGSQHLFAQRRNYFSYKHWRLLIQINRFYQEASEVLNEDRFATMSMADYVKERKYSSEFLYQYLVPMSSALWSTPIDVTMQYPVRVLVQFFKNHGMLGINTQFQWYTVNGGSWEYRDRLIAPYKEKIKVDQPVVSVERDKKGVLLTTKDGRTKHYDRVIFACHADQAIQILGNHATPLQSSLLTPFTYQKNVAVLHSDEVVMPKIRKVWSAWNYRVQQVNGAWTAATTYDMNILQQVSPDRNYFVTLNDQGNINPTLVHRTINYHHPVFTVQTAKAQKELPMLNEDGPMYFCGSYFRFGFHEDAFTSAVNLCENLLEGNPWSLLPVTKSTAAPELVY